MVLDRCNS